MGVNCLTDHPMLIFSSSSPLFIYIVFVTIKIVSRRVTETQALTPNKQQRQGKTPLQEETLTRLLSRGPVREENGRSMSRRRHVISTNTLIVLSYQGIGLGDQRSAGQRITMRSAIPVDEYRERQKRWEREAQNLRGKCVNDKERKWEEREREKTKGRKGEEKTGHDITMTNVKLQLLLWKGGNPPSSATSETGVDICNSVLHITVQLCCYSN